MHRRLAFFAFGLACVACLGAEAQPTAVPTVAGAGAVAPSDQTAVKPSLPDERANRTVTLGTAPPTPAPLPMPAPPPPPATTAAPPTVEEPGRSEPDTGAAPAAAGSVHRKPGVAPRPVSVAKAPSYTVVALDGKSLTLRRAEGTTVTFPLAKKADVPKGLAPGQSVMIKTRTENGKKVVSRVREASGAPVLTNVN
jgi:hypothetical protein